MLSLGIVAVKGSIVAVMGSIVAVMEHCSCHEDYCGSHGGFLAVINCIVTVMRALWLSWWQSVAIMELTL